MIGPKLSFPHLNFDREGAGGGPSGSGLLLETGGGYLQLENGSYILLE
jgi:hypothetical protein